MVIKDDPLIISHFNEFEKSKDIEEFYNQLIILAPAVLSTDENASVNTPIIKDTKDIKDIDKSKASSIAQMSSPIGNDMLKRKRDFDKEIKHPILSKGDQTVTKLCDIGKSPEMMKPSLKEKLNKS